MEWFVSIAIASWGVLGQMAPYLLLGFLVAGLLSTLVAPESVERHLGGRGLGPVLKATLFGIPLPLCSCSVIPVAVSMHQHGASRAATTAFLLSTPQTGVDSILVTYGMMGPAMAVFRPLAALVSGLLGGGLVALCGGPDPARGVAVAEHGAARGGCCCDKTDRRGHVARMLRYGLLTLPRDIAVPLLVGVVLAGAISVLASPGELAAYLGGGVLSIVLMMAAGIPLYVCATASVPLAVGFMHVGASPGAALAFLIAGPGTNAAAFTTLYRALGGRVAALYVVAVAVSALGAGVILDSMSPLLPVTLAGAMPGCHVESASGVAGHVWAAALLLVLAASCRWGGAGARGQ